MHAKGKGQVGSKVEVSVKCFSSLSANPTKWSNTLKQFVANLPTNCLSVFDHFVILALKGLRIKSSSIGGNLFSGTKQCSIYDMNINRTLNKKFYIYTMYKYIQRSVTF